MTGFAAALHDLENAATVLAPLAKDTGTLATDLEGACEAPPKVGDTQATAVYQQGHYDWTQTRFEDLSASQAHLDVLVTKFRETAKQYANDDQQAQAALTRILSALDTPADGTGH